jgi:hypothetical protein
MSANHNTDGLARHDIFIEDDTIRLSISTGSIAIGEVDDLFAFKPYSGGTFCTQNGVEIDLEEFIDHMAVSSKMAEVLKCAPKEKAGRYDLFTQRMHIFHGVLFNELHGNITINDD